MVVKVVDGKDENTTRSFCDLVETMVSPDCDARVAVDCEGVNLSRRGSVEIISVAFETQPDTAYLVDFHQHDVADTDRYDATKKLLENDGVRKIIHDCRMDCDALFHLHQIRMVNIHDTSRFHEEICGKEAANLNDTLLDNGIRTNTIRDKSVYKNNHTFWATRPLTTTMKNWASGDVSKLFELGTKQDKSLSLSAKRSDRALAMGDEWSNLLVDKNVEMSVECLIPIGRFIGRRGANIRSLEKRTGCFMYGKSFGPADDGRFMVYYSSEASLQQVKHAMGHY